MGLKLKIFIGYAMLILLLGFIIYLFRGERMKRDELKWEMKELVSIRSRACLFPFFSFLPLCLHYNLNP